VGGKEKTKTVRKYSWVLDYITVILRNSRTRVAHHQILVKFVAHGRPGNNRLGTHCLGTLRLGLRGGKCVAKPHTSLIYCFNPASVIKDSSLLKRRVLKQKCRESQGVFRTLLFQRYPGFPGAGADIAETAFRAKPGLPGRHANIFVTAATQA
jgi:hypothetical protein